MSWEENEDFLPSENQAPASRSAAPALNPNAFSFNPGASTFSTTFAAAPAAPSPVLQAPAPASVRPAAASFQHQPADAPQTAPPAASHAITNGVAPMDEDVPANGAGRSTREEKGKLTGFLWGTICDTGRVRWKERIETYLDMGYCGSRPEVLMARLSDRRG